MKALLLGAAALTIAGVALFAFLDDPLEPPPTSGDTGEVGVEPQLDPQEPRAKLDPSAGLSTRRTPARDPRPSSPGSTPDELTEAEIAHDISAIEALLVNATPEQRQQVVKAYLDALQMLKRIE